MKAEDIIAHCESFFSVANIIPKMKSDSYIFLAMFPCRKGTGNLLIFSTVRADSKLYS